MNKTDILSTADKLYSRFTSVLQGERFQPRGIFNSEALLLLALVEYFSVKQVIESGRARGHSTNLLAKYLEGSHVTITSVDYDRSSDDAKYSEGYLSKYENLKLLYGDANKLLPRLITEDCIIFIDGPKGEDALRLTAKLMTNKHVKAVAVHDLHKNGWPRNVADLIFSNSFYSDDSDYVERFKSLDTDCWSVLEGSGEAPYTRFGKPITSYASTIGVFFNSEKPMKEPAYANYIADYSFNRPTLKRWVYSKIYNKPSLVRLISKIKSR